MRANDYQVGGDHYKAAGKVEHWDFVWQHNLDYFQGQITKYVMRWKRKGGLRDLEKARHFLEKYIELVKSDSEGGPVEVASDTAQTLAQPAQQTCTYPPGYKGLRY